ncbi:hypothetical protein [Flammeovirga aprica]|uniref:Uncharacterized protein n=1 Tax=Flammeovirga aprica JL-4 TaxID=694437 RepID=A0A7X9P2M5_9BACT|nr:hypothetical protein [Flammeovirga aprica]NME68053.1 hypothetical protein [Flammeovirga aprica JL-4]
MAEKALRYLEKIEEEYSSPNHNNKEIRVYQDKLIEKLNDLRKNKE